MRVRQTLSENECEAVVVKRVRKLWLKESGQRIGAGTPTLNLLRLVINPLTFMQSCCQNYHHSFHHSDELML